jgi:serine/threonine protein kinase
MKPSTQEGFPCQYGKYQLLARIGHGGMAEVFRARLPGVAGFEKIVVIKRLLPHLAQDRSILEMFLNEAKIAAEVQHRNVVQVFELGQSESGEFYMAMEHVAGTDLRQILRAAAINSMRIPPWFSVHMVAEILDGLAYAHELADEAGRRRNIVHRDVTPANIFVSYLGDIKLGDFGVAKDDSRNSLTRAGQLKGKVPYMSPEQLFGRDLDERTDVFAAGAVLWECLTQRRLFGGRPDIEAMNLICYGDRKAPSVFASDVPPLLDQIVLRALSADFTQRTRSARELRDELHAVLPQLRERVLQTDVRSIVESLLGNRDPSANTGPRSIQDEAVSRQNFFEATPGTPRLDRSQSIASPWEPQDSRRTPSPPLGYAAMQMLRDNTTTHAPVSPRSPSSSTNDLVPPMQPPNPPRSQSSPTGYFVQPQGAPKTMPPSPRPHSSSGYIVNPSASREAMPALFADSAPAHTPPPLELEPAPPPPVRYTTQPPIVSGTPLAPPPQPPMSYVGPPIVQGTPLPSPRPVSSSRWATPQLDRSHAREFLPGAPADSFGSMTGPIDASGLFPPIVPTRDLQVTDDFPRALLSTEIVQPSLPSIMAAESITEEAIPHDPFGPSLTTTGSVDKAVQAAIEDVLTLQPETVQPVATTTSALAGLDHRRHAVRIADHALGDWRDYVMVDANYEGPHPFWVRAHDGAIVGPLGINEAVTVLRAECRAGHIDEVQISGNQTTWMDASTFAILTGQEIVTDRWSHKERDLPKSSIAGTFQQTSATALFGRIAREKPTGRLIMLNPGYGQFVRREIVIVDGRPTFAYANELELQLPDLLIQRKLTSKEQVAEMVHCALIHDRALEQVVLDRAGVDVTPYWTPFMKDRVLDVFKWKNAKFALDFEAPITHTQPFAGSMLALLPEMVHRAKTTDELRLALAPFLSLKLERSERWSKGVQELKLGEPQLQTVHALGSAKTLAQALKQGMRDERINLTLAYVLLETDLLLKPLQ